MHRQKVAEVEKLSQTVRELEESVLAGGAAANAVRDYQRKVQEMNVIFLACFQSQSSCNFLKHFNLVFHKPQECSIVLVLIDFAYFHTNMLYLFLGGEENP